MFSIKFHTSLIYSLTVSIKKTMQDSFLLNYLRIAVKTQNILLQWIRAGMRLIKKAVFTDALNIES